MQMMTRGKSTGTEKTLIEPFKPDPYQAELSEELLEMAKIIDSVLPGKGKEMVVNLCRVFAGTYVYFPQSKQMFRKARDGWIIKQYERGIRVVGISRHINLSQRQVWNILGR